MNKLLRSTKSDVQNECDTRVYCAVRATGFCSWLGMMVPLDATKNLVSWPKNCVIKRGPSTNVTEMSNHLNGEG